MEVNEHPFDQRPWRVFGQRGGVKISAAPPGLLKVEVDDFTAVIPYPIVIALQSKEAIELLSRPEFAEFLNYYNERESRIRAARKLASQQIAKKRREFVEALKAMHVSEQEAWSLARIKYPLDI